jgi:hypothetical protein
MALSPSFALSLSPTVLSGRLQFGAVLRRKACAVGASSPTCLGSLSRDHRSECRVTPELRGQSDFVHRARLDCATYKFVVRAPLAFSCDGKNGFRQRFPEPLKIWRRERDSNPRYPLRYTRFRGARLQPLGHLSASQIVLCSFYQPQTHAACLALILLNGSRFALCSCG